MSDFYKEQISDLNDHVEGLEAENKVFREALEKIESMANTCCLHRNISKAAKEALYNNSN